jgi:ribosomal protein S27E
MKNMKNITRDEIESRGRCEWFDMRCPDCGEKMKAYQGSDSALSDYSLLCGNYDCKNWMRVAELVDTSDRVEESDFSDINYR